MAIKFNLSSISGISNISKATLSIYRAGNVHEGPDGAGEDFIKLYDFDSKFNIHKLTKAWKESDATWQTLSDAYETTPLATYEFKTGYKGWIEYDLTAAVKEYSKNPDKNFGFVLLNDMKPKDNYSGNLSEFCSSEKSEVDQRPKLTITTGETSVKEFNKNTLTRDFIKAYYSDNKIYIKINSNEMHSVAMYSLNGKEFSPMSYQTINNGTHVFLCAKYCSQVCVIAVSSGSAKVVTKMFIPK